MRGERKKGLAIFVGMKERKTSKTVKKNQEKREERKG